MKKILCGLISLFILFINSYIYALPLTIIVDSIKTPSCNGGNNGSINISVSGGISPYKFIWSNNDTIEDISNLIAGLYSVTVTDSNLQTVTSTITLSDLPALSIVSIVDSAKCSNESTGDVSLQVSGGTIPYKSYLWSNGTTTKDILNVNAGIYTVTVTDQNDCTASNSSIVSEPDSLILSVTSTDVKCNGGNTGSIDLTVTGGISSYFYSWSNGAVTQDISELVSGTYIVYVTDQNMCNANILVNINEPTTLNATFSLTNVKCKGENSGLITVNATGGTSPYLFSKDSVNFTTNNVFSNLLAGNYIVTVKDKNQCINLIPVIISEPPTIVQAIIDLTTSKYKICNGTSGGIAVVLAAGGISPYAYSWTNQIGTIIGNASITNNLSAGTYTVTVRDKNNCNTQTNISIIDNPVLNLNVQPYPLVVCYKDSALLNALPGGGTSPYSIIWSTGSTSQSIWVKAGSYKVIVTDVMGCKDSMEIQLEENPLIQVIVNTPPTVCYGYPATLIANVNGGSGDFQYQWYDQNNNMVGTDKNNLLALSGNYYVYITDNIHGLGKCLASSQMFNVTEFPELFLSSSVTNATCNGCCDGKITTYTSGGAGFPYTYQWSNGKSTSDIPGLCPGDYKLTLTDGNGCQMFIYDTIKVDKAGSLFEDINESEKVSIYPMPFDNILTLSLSENLNGKITCNLLNVLGQSIKSIHTNANGKSAKCELDLSELKPGMYILEVEISGKKGFYKVQKIK